MDLNVPKSSMAIMKDQIKLLSIAEGFFESEVLFALLKLEIFERIGEETQTLNALAADLGTRPETLSRLLNAGVVLKLLESKDGLTFRVADSCRSALLASAGENYLGNWIRNLDYLRSVFSGLDEVVLNSGPVVPPAHPGVDENHTYEFTLAMHNYASVRGQELAQFLDTSNCRSLLDLGCGPGTYAFHLGMRNPSLELYLLDLPKVLEVAKEVQTRYAIQNAVNYLPLDALRDEIPGSYDMILVSNMLYMIGEPASRQLIERLYHAVNSGGSLEIQSQYLQDKRLGGRWPIFIDLLQLCMTSKGRNHTVAETRRWLADAGFLNVEFCPMTVLNTNSFVRGYKG
jgi:SAM-dependent methyltransferase